MFIEQSTYATIAKYQSRTCKAIFAKPTKPGSLLVAMDSTAGTIPSRVSTPSGFTSVVASGLRDVQLNAWYRPNAPATTEVAVTALDDNKSHQVRVFEISGMASIAVLDRVAVKSGEDRDPTSGSTGITTQADELVIGMVVNQYSGTSQTGFGGGFTRLFESTSPQKWSGGTNQEWERSRLSVHIIQTTQVGNFHLHCDLDTTRRWIAAVLTFKGGNIGPIKMSSTVKRTKISVRARGQLSVFGPLTSTGPTKRAKITTRARGSMSLFNYQYRIGGRTGLLIGSGTPFHVEGTEGLGGWTVRTSDDPLPRGAGSLRGIDLQDARQIIMKMNVGKGREEVERNMAELFRALVPQRDTDVEMWFRFPTLPVQMIRCRPIDLGRIRDRDQLQFASQKIALQAADPRHYSAVPKMIDIPVTPVGAIEPVRTPVVNIGNSAAYPIIHIEGPMYGASVSRLQLVNETALVAFEAELVLNNGSTLVADMDARIRGSAEATITLDGQTKYNTWQLPREPFRIDPDPTGFGGYNNLYLRTEPAGAPVRCWLEYRDTWAG